MGVTVFGPGTLSPGVRTGRPFVASFEERRVRRGLWKRQSTVGGRLCRDGSGRVRTEYRLRRLWVTSSVVAIADPVGGWISVIDPLHRTCGRSEYAPPLDGKALTFPPDAERRMWEGLRCVRVPSFGNIAEAWFCEELDQVVYEKRLTLEEDIEWRLVDISYTEPDPELFIPPRDYRLLENPAPAGCGIR